MIFIDLKNNPPSQALIDEGIRLTQELNLITDEKERKAFIDENADYWGKLKDHYKKLSNGKCWYSEAKETVSPYHMDHFRPKNAIKLATRKCKVKSHNSKEPYWWLAFDWENYRLSGHLPNTNKNAYFPLRINTPIATCKVECINEVIGLLDPTDEDDTKCLGFDENGFACSISNGIDLWKEQRVSFSIILYNLNTPDLVDARKEVQNTCRYLIQEIINSHHDMINQENPEFKNYIKGTLIKRIKELKEKTKATAELSAVAKKYILSHPSPLINKIAS